MINNLIQANLRKRHIEISLQLTEGEPSDGIERDVIDDEGDVMVSFLWAPVYFIGLVFVYKNPFNCKMNACGLEVYDVYFSIGCYFWDQIIQKGPEIKFLNLHAAIIKYYTRVHKYVKVYVGH